MKRRRSAKPRDANLVIEVGGTARSRATIIRRVARGVLRAEGRASGRLEIAILDAAAMRRAHRMWRGKSGVTDVLSFDLRERTAGRDVDGVILVCEDVARREGRRRGTDALAELLLYVVHGCLHLCEYDDMSAVEFRRMHAREDELLAALGYGRVFSGRDRDSRRAGGRSRRGARPAR